MEYLFSKQRGYVAVSLIILTLLASFILFPRKFAPVDNIKQNVSLTEMGCPLIIRDNILIHAPSAEFQGNEESGGYVYGNKINYRKIRGRVGIRNTFFNRGRIPKPDTGIGDHGKLYQGTDTDVDLTKYQIWYPDVAASIDIKGQEFIQLQDPKGRRGSKISMPAWGLLFLLILDPDGQPLNLKVPNNNKVYYVADIYQEESKYLDPKTGPLPEVVFSCPADLAAGGSATSSATGAQIKIPPQEISADRKQLQLEYFLFEESEITNVGSTVVFDPNCKPAIYLYPPYQMKVNVKVKTKGKLTYTDPPYPVSGWDVEAYPDGKIKIQDTRNKIQPYPYLYYESKVADNLIDIPSSGYTVSFDKLVDLYQTVLPSLGLNSTQTDDFISYWSKALPYSPYYFVGIMNQTNINEIEPLEITPKPDAVNRVRVYFKPLDKKPALSISEPISSNYQLPPTTYNLFKVTEWGGMVKTDPLHPFTCSQ